MSDPSTKRGGKRSKSGCHTCRSRKVRCDEREGVCGNCERLGLPCLSSQSPSRSDGRATSTPTIGVGLKRKRTFRSCVECRATKTRCSGDNPCVRCRQKSLACSYEDSSEPTWKQQLRLTTSRTSEDDPHTGASTTGHTAHGSPRDGASLVHDGPSTQRHNQDLDDSYDEHRWLRSSYLPGNDEIRGLVEYYFMNVHPLRCFGFLHKPSFMQRLDTEDGHRRNDDALLLIVCALGALFFTAESSAPPAIALAAGSQWAKRAQQLILSQFGDIAVENLMAAVLLHDYQLRMSNFGDAFMLSAVTARMAQALQITLEHSTDVLCQDPGSGPSASTKESRRRLAWSCYITDSLVGTGVDQLTLIREADIKIQLPCTESNFLRQTACIMEVLEKGQFLAFLGRESIPQYPVETIGIRAHFVRHISIRRRVLKYIKHLHEAKLPWFPDSEFQKLDAENRAWYESLPASLHFTSTAMYIRKETCQLGALCLLHLVYHQTMCDLYRIGAPALYKVRSAFSFPPEQSGFLRHLQRELFVHARELATITAEALRHGPHALADSWVPTIVYDCSRVMLYYVTQLIDPAADSSRDVMTDTISLVQSNIKALRMMQSMYSVAELLANAAERMLEKMRAGTEVTPSGHSVIPDEPYNESDDNEGSAPGTPVQSAPDYVLNPLSIYRMTRKAIPEKHAPEKQLHATPPSVSSTSRSGLQRRATLQHVPVAPYAGSGGENTTAFTQDNPYMGQPSQADFNGLLPLFASDPSGWTWQPADTAMGYESIGLPPWEPTFVDQQLDAWMPMFSDQTQQYDFQ